MVLSIPSSLAFYRPVGETDSENAFCLIMDRLRKLGPNPSVDDETRVIESSALELSDTGGFNFLMSDGKRLYAFWSGYNELHYAVRAPPHTRKVSMVDEDFRVNLSEIKGKDEVATIIATRPLTDEPWVPFPNRKLLVFEKGLLKLEELEWRILALVRNSPRRVALREASVELRISVGEAAEAMRRLMVLGLVRQDSRDTVRSSHPDATFYTEPDAREAIDSMLRALPLCFKD